MASFAGCRLRRLRPVVRDDEGKETDEKKWEQINKAQALWTRNKSDISEKTRLTDQVERFLSIEWGKIAQSHLGYF